MTKLPNTSTILAVAGMAACLSSAHAQSLDEIIVTANRSPEPLSRVGQSVTVIDATTIKLRQSESVADLLRDVPGISIARNGGIGSTTSVFIRGANSDQTVALIDGVKLNDPASPGGGFDFGNLLVGNIARIEVLRGPSSVLWGSQAIGGVVNLITVPPTESLKANARAEYGFRNTGQLVANISGKAGLLSASAGGGYFRTDGISAFSEARGGREKDGFRNYGANLNFNLALSDTISVDARGYYSDGKIGIDGFAPPTFAFGDTRELSKTREFVGYTGLNAAFFDGRLHNRFGLAYTDTRRRNENPDATSVETFASNGRNERLEYQGIFEPMTSVKIIFGGEHEVSRFHASDSGGAVGRASINSVYGQLLVTPLSGLTVTGGVRHDQHSQFGGTTNFAGSAVYSPNDGVTTLRASYSEGFKAPSLYQLNSIYGNRALKPETSQGWDVGIAQKLLKGAAEVSATWFGRTSRNLIDFNFCNAVGDPSPLCIIESDGFLLYGYYDNINKAKAKGLELSLKLKPVDALQVSANYSFTQSRDELTGLELARRPKQSVNAALDYHWAFGLNTGATITHVASSFNDPGNTQKLQAYTLVDLRAVYAVTKTFEVYGRIENLANERYETVFLYGTPRRAGYIGARLSY